jgi:Fuc2NAc and GlcNAc transferase
MPALVIALASFGTSLLIVWLVRGYARRRRLLDRPNARSAHTTPTPRLGGIGIAAGFLGCAALGCTATGFRGAWPLLAATACVSVVGLVDDLRPLPARLRFSLQIAAAAAVVFAYRDGLGPALPGWLPLPGPIAAAAVIVWIVWLTNLYNFMDGIDGIAAGQAVVAALALALAARGAGAPGAALLLAALGAASAGFLVFNFPPASIFMGDVGSTAIGFFFACAPLLPGEARVPFEAVWIALGLFVLDATTTLVRRVARGERFFEAHRTHWYQRPLALGIRHRNITTVACAAMVPLAAAAAAWPAAPWEARPALMALPVLVFAGLAALVRGLERSRVAPRGENG